MSEKSPGKYGGVLYILAILADILGVFSFVGIGPFPINSWKLSFVLFALSFCFFLGGLYKTMRVIRQANKIQLKLEAATQCFSEIHNINHYYRDVMKEVMGNPPALCIEDVRHRLNQERLILGEVCQRIAAIFVHLTSVRCVVCVTLASEEKSTKEIECFIWARSIYDPRDAAILTKKFKLAANTRFEEATKTNETGLAFFQCPDLEEFVNYKDEINDWKTRYLSCIVVPIRQISRSGEIELLGFLKVEVMVKNVLNRSAHVQLMAGFADQIHSFLSLRKLPNALKTST